MRITGGAWRGRQIGTPGSTVTRPYTERVREAVFDALGSHMGTPGGLPPIVVLDLFAGSGAMGFEALSRGAAMCVFVENHPAALRRLRENVAALGAGDRVRVMAVDAARLRLGPPDDEAAIELVFVDPPYAMTASGTRRRSIPAILGRLAEQPAIARNALFLLRHERVVRFDAAVPPGYQLFKRRDYGNMSITWLTFAEASAADSAGGGGEG